MSVQETAASPVIPGAVRGATRQADLAWRLLTPGLVAVDALAVGLAFALAYLIRFKTGLPLLETPAHSLDFYSSVTYWAVPVWLAIFALYRLYDQRYLFAGFQEYLRLLNACTAGMLAVIVVSFLDVTLLISRGWLLLVWGLAIVMVAVERFLVRRAIRWLRRRGLLVTCALIVGTNEEARALAEQLSTDASSGTRILGLVGSASAGELETPDTVPVLGTVADLEHLVNELSIGEIVVATTALSRDELLDLYRTFGPREGVEIRMSSGLFEILTTGVRVQEISCVPLMTPQRVRITGLDAVLKALLDYTGAFLGLVALSPVMLIVAILVKIDSPGPLFHRRRALGRGGKYFNALKFRTMVADADALLAADEVLRKAFEEGYKLRVDPRVTRLGRILRRTSLDELPQLVNVLGGEMSLVGPRMIAPEEAFRYGKWRLNLLTVKPGITGPWQVHGRSDIPYEERVRLSMQYIRNYSIWLDLEILVRTVMVVLRARGAY
ncbi:MAG: sugar transferase [Dehalococcoidales bacterium]|nr:sugar transferase [Dehalococcoidales bacterium]